MITLNDPEAAITAADLNDVERRLDFTFPSEFRDLYLRFNGGCPDRNYFVDDNGACMIVSDQSSVMLLSEPFFKTFTKRALCDTSTHTEGLFALACGSRADVDAMVEKAIAAGGRHAMDRQDHGFMYAWSFYDLDGHHWEVFWMDPKTGEAGVH